MSGDNYTQCPRCKIIARRFDDEIQRKVDSWYGKCSARQFQLVQKQAETVKNPYREDNTSFREDYQIGVDDGGRLNFGYYGCCHVCGYEVTASDSNVVTVDPMPQDATAEDRAYDAWGALHIVEVDE